MNFSKMLKEGRVDDFKSKYRTKFSNRELQQIIDNISPKYLMWVGKVFDGINFEENFQKLYSTLNKFDNISSNLPKTDINQYGDLNELMEAISTYENRERRTIKKVKGGNVVFDDGKLFVVNPLDHSTSCYYGKGTKWCTAAESSYNFNKYNEDGKLFYIIDRTKPTNDSLYKIALLQKFNGDKIFYDAKDEVINKDWFLNSGEYNQLLSSITDYMNDEYAEQIKIFTDKELEKKERERLRKLEINRILTQRRNEAEQRRLDGEWELGPDCPEEGLKAHALLDWLESNGDVDVLSNEDRSNILRINTELEALQDEYDSEEGNREDIQQQIDELEEELNEYDGYIDVYNIIPTGNFYRTTEFEVIDSPVDDRRYAVGTEGEMQTSCEEYVDNLIDDIGFEGFNHDFTRNYLDIDKIADYAYDTYDDYVRENPDSYLDESDRMLSNEQEETIEIFELRIRQAREAIEKFESQLGGEHDEWIESKIEELNERIDEYDQEIEDIRAEPDGDFPEDLIDEKVLELSRDVRSDVESFLSEFGLDWEDFIDRDEFISGVIDEDGFGHTLNGYDGNADEEYVNDELFYVMRID